MKVERFTGVVVGQECICPDGLGRISEIHPNGVTVETYMHNRSCHWSRDNVILCPLYILTAVEESPT